MSFKLSSDPKFLEKMTDVVGLYLNPPQQAIVLCVEEKSQIQALDRTQTGLPLKKGRCGTVGGGERMGYFGGPKWARPPRDDGGESVGNPTKLIKWFAAVSS
jgi:hypothetical protein